MANLLNLIITASEKAANIARVCRDSQELFNLLVEEKKGDEASTRFFQDFKTLADVLIQETVRHDIATHVRVFNYLYIFTRCMKNTLNQTEF